MFAKKIKAFQVYMDGEAMGITSAFTPPNFKRKTIKYRGGAMLSEMESDVGVERTAAKITFETITPEIWEKFATCNAKGIELQLMASAENENCEVIEVSHTMTGRFLNISNDEMKAGENYQNVWEFDTNEYSYKIDNKEIYYFDIMGTERSGGVDRTEKRRQAIGLTG